MSIRHSNNLRAVKCLQQLCSVLIPIALLCIATLESRSAEIRDTTAQPIDSSLTTTKDTIRTEYLPGPFDMITNLPRDWYRFGAIAFRTENIPLFCTIAASTGAMIATDHESWQLFDEPYKQHPWFHEASDYATFIGDGKFQGGLAAAFAVYGFLFGDTVAIRTASQTVEVVLACGAVVQVLKHLTGRESPFVATTPTGRWAWFPNQVEYHKHIPHYDAFPSGHVATLLATVTVIAENYPQEKWIPWVGYSMVTATAIGLVATGIHWWSDYPLSIALGYGFGMLISHQNDPVQPQKQDKSVGYNFQSAPTLGIAILSDGTPAANFSWSW